ncbi:MAG: hypothetical protein HQM13_11865 [SAR324 cluster bacterium]|nr:hypothetical protein [SAR324 cluster bacterium]
MKFKSFVLSLGILMTFFSFELMSQETSTHYLGRAYDMDSGELVYSEEYLESAIDGRPQEATVTYFSPSGKVIAEKEIAFGKMLTSPDFLMTDMRDGYTEGVMSEGSQFKIIFKKDRDSTEVETHIEPSGPVVADAGFHYFILENWETLLSGKTLTFNFIVPTIQEFLKFEIQKVENEKKETQERIQFKTGVSNFLLKAFMNPILLTYDRRTRLLLQYEGLSNVNNDEGKSHNVRIRMEYQGNSMSLGNLQSR